MSYTFVRVINNNAIVGADRKGEEVILLGKGIGVRCIKHRRYIVCVQSDRKGVRCGKKGQ